MAEAFRRDAEEDAERAVRIPISLLGEAGVTPYTASTCLRMAPAKDQRHESVGGFILESHIILSPN